MAVEQPGAVLVVHDGELDDVCCVLEQAGIAFDEARPGGVAGERCLSAPLTISSPPFLLECLRKGEPAAGPRMAMLEKESRTARSMLVRGGVEWMVRRPVHPAALQLLVLHCLYSGPERRKTKRVSIGARVRFRVGWRQQAGVLEELSARDCRILSKRKRAIGDRVKLTLPAEFAGRRSLRIEGRVVRVAAASGDEGASEICLVFDALSAVERVRLEEVVAAHRRGPAVLRDATSVSTKRSEPNRDAERTVIAFREPSELADEAEQGPEAAHAETPARRGDSRHSFERRVISMGGEATRVLVGRNISLGGMCVNPTPTLALGDELQIAIHAPGIETPLVARVNVARDDGERGLVLSFVDLSKPTQAYLREMLANLPGLVSSDDESATGESPCVVSEILEQRTA